MKVFKQNKVLFLLLSFVLCASACFILTNGVVASAVGNSTRGQVDYSLAKVSEATSVYVNMMSNPAMEGLNEVPSNIIAGNAGGLLGYYDTDAVDRVSWVSSRDSSNAVTWGYSNIGNLRANNGSHSFSPNTTTAATNGPIGYGMYGYFLTYLGLDEVTFGSRGSGMRTAVGILMVALYVLAIGMSSFFNLAIGVMQVINPFRLFAPSTHLTSWIDKIDAQAGNAPGGIGGILANAVSALANNIGKFYDALYNISLFVLIPIFLAGALFMWLVVNKGQNFSKIFRPFFVRIVFLVIGVPLLFGVYDAILESAKGSVSVSDSPATRVIGGIFCDFGNWVLADGSKGGQYSLVLPNRGINYMFDADTMQADAASVLATRAICMDLNKALHPNTFGNYNIANSSGSLTGYANFDVAMMSNTSKPEFKTGTTANPVNFTANLGQISDILSILTRYSSGEIVSASAYESNVVKGLMNDSSDPGLQTGVVVLFNTSQSWTDYDDKSIGEKSYSGNDGTGVSAGSNNNPKNTAINIHITEDEAKNIPLHRWTSGSYETCGNGHAPNIFTNGNLRANLSGKNWQFTCSGGQALSSLATYNYLNSMFSATGVSVSSPVSSANDLVKYNHYSVTLVGHGIMKVIYLLDAIALLSCTSIIGYGYGLSMLVANFKAMFKLIPSVFAGMMGSIRSIAAAVALMFAMICEVVATVLLFNIAMDIVYGIYSLIELPLATLLDGAAGGLNGAATIMTALLGLISVCAILTICQKLLQWRQAIVSAITASFTQIVNKFLETNVTPPDLSTDASGMAGKAATLAIAGGSIAAAAGSSLADNHTANAIKNDLRDGFVGKNGLANSAGAMLAYGAKHGNGSGYKTNVDGELSVNGQADSKEGGLFDSYDNRGGSGNKSRENLGASSNSIDKDAAEFVTDENNQAAFNEALNNDIGEDDMGNPYVGDDASDMSLQDYFDKIQPNYTSSSTKDGITTTVSRNVGKDGSVTTTKAQTNENTGDSMKAVSVDSVAETSLTVDSQFADGTYSHEQTVTSKETGAQHIEKRSLNKMGEKVSVTQDVSKDNLGNTTTRSSTSKLAANGTSSGKNETIVESADGGSVTVSRDVIENESVTAHVEERHRRQSSGNFVVDSVSKSSNGETTTGRAICKPSTVGPGGGSVISSEETVRDSQQNIINHRTTRVTDSSNMVQTVVNSEQGGVQTNTVTNINKADNSKNVVTSGRGADGNTTKTVESYSFNSAGGYDLVNRNVTNYRNDTVATNTSYNSKSNTSYENNSSYTRNNNTSYRNNSSYKSNDSYTASVSPSSNRGGSNGGGSNGGGNLGASWGGFSGERTSSYGEHQHSSGSASFGSKDSRGSSAPGGRDVGRL